MGKECVYEFWDFRGLQIRRKGVFKMIIEFMKLVSRMMNDILR